MRALPNVRPTPEQLSIISRNRPGTELIRGAAGSGKTTTALLKLRTLIGVHLGRKRRQQQDEAVHILVLTFNRTLRGYIEAVAEDQASDRDEIDLEISTFGKWARDSIGKPKMADARARAAHIRKLGTGIPLSPDFLVDEVEYVLGRFRPEDLPNYLTVRRVARGTQPRVERPVRKALLEDVLGPYKAWKQERDLFDWNDVAVELQDTETDPPYDLIIVDEAQDFSANDLRAIRLQLAATHSFALVVDTAQRIYSRGFTWQEAGIAIRPENSHRLERNYRNTAEIARFAASLIQDLPPDPDATLPNFDSCEEHGEMPVVLRGRFDAQVDYAIEYIRDEVDLEQESVAFFHPLGGGWMDHLRKRLRAATLAFVEISRSSEWPTGPENVALSTLASAKGLEFDHVFILGLNAEVLKDGNHPEDDERLARLRRLMAMGIGRAKKGVVLGYKPEDASQLIDYFDEDTYDAVAV